MDNKTILEKAIQKAIDGGWKTTLCSSFISWTVSDNLLGESLPFVYVTMFGNTSVEHSSRYIYDHDFAKALWGEYAEGYDPRNYVGMAPGFGPAEPWKTHLQQMVIADDPIKYLGENL